MKIEMDIKKRYVYFLTALIVVLAGAVLVIGYATDPADPSKFGHTANEIDAGSDSSIYGVFGAGDYSFPSALSIGGDLTVTGASTNFLNAIKSATLNDFHNIGGIDAQVTSVDGLTGGTISSALTVGGDVTASAFYYSSDESLKKNIQPIPNALGNILKLDGVSFQWKENDKQSIGIIAQDLEMVFPELVSTDENTGLKSLQYGQLVAVLIEAMKEQQKQIEELKREIEKLNKQ